MKIEKRYPIIGNAIDFVKDLGDGYSEYCLYEDYEQTHYIVKDEKVIFEIYVAVDGDECACIDAFEIKKMEESND